MLEMDCSVALDMFMLITCLGYTYEIYNIIQHTHIYIYIYTYWDDVPNSNSSGGLQSPSRWNGAIGLRRHVPGGCPLTSIPFVPIGGVADVGELGCSESGTMPKGCRSNQSCETSEKWALKKQTIKLIQHEIYRTCF